MPSMVTAPTPYSPPFPEFDNKYKCCCRACHVKNGTLIVGIINAIGLTMTLINNGITMSRMGSNPDLKPLLAVEIVSIILMVSEAAALVFLFLGWVKEKKFLLIPYLAVQVFQMLYIVAMLIFIIVVAVKGGHFADEVLASMMSMGADVDDAGFVVKLGVIAYIVFAFIVLGLMLIVEIWLFTVVLGCFRFFSDKEKFYKERLIHAEYGMPVEEELGPYGQIVNA